MNPLWIRLRGALALCGTVLVALALSACATPAAAPPPKLVVLIAIDGLPMWQVTAYRDQLAPDGLARFLERGAWYADAHHGHAYTVTAAGHAAMLTGAYPQRSGIIGNQWRDPQTGQPEYCTGDTAHRYIGHATQALDGTSPKNLKAQTVGDVLRRADPRSKVLAVSGKDRGAILTAGHSGTAYMYMAQSGQFASSTYYMPAHPAWVDAFNAARPADRYFRAEWKPLLPEAAYARSVPDGQPWFGPRGGALPMTMGVAEDERPGPQFYGSLLRSPFGDALTLDFARAALAGERLGQDDAPDLLSVSLSGHDYVNHAYGAESRISHDHLLQLDRLLQQFFAHLDATVGRDQVLLVLTSDHGFMPVPEYSSARGVDAGRLNGSHLLGRINAALQQQFGAAGLARYYSASAVVLDHALISQKGLNADRVAEATRDALRAEPAMGAAWTRREIAEKVHAGQPLFDAMRRSWHPQLSGDVPFALKPHWMMSSGTSGATHGSPHRYDTHVPILLYGPRWVPAGPVDARVAVVDIAPTLARWLRVDAPATSEGQPLPLPAR